MPAREGIHERPCGRDAMQCDAMQCGAERYLPRCQRGREPVMQSPIVGNDTLTLLYGFEFVMDCLRHRFRREMP